MPIFTFKNTKIAYTDDGAGSLIVLLHGFLENKEMWHCYTPQLSAKNRVISIDLLGHGQTDCLGYIHSMELQAELVYALLNALDIKKTTLIGHSMGGYVALAFAEYYPNSIDRLVLLNSTSYDDTDDKKINRTRAINAVKLNANAFIRLSIGNLFSEKNRVRLETKIEIIRTEALKTPLQGIIAALEGMKVRKNRHFVLKAAPFDITLILGKQDPVLNYDETILQVQNTKVKLITLPDGHMSWIENQIELHVIFKALFN